MFIKYKKVLFSCEDYIRTSPCYPHLTWLNSGIEVYQVYEKVVTQHFEENVSCLKPRHLVWYSAEDDVRVNTAVRFKQLSGACKQKAATASVLPSNSFYLSKSLTESSKGFNVVPKEIEITVALYGIQSASGGHSKQLSMC